jgi:Na+-transporting methylmalonyl-CoA/oxaloacetate decarboxylase gamma subunit
MAVNLSIALVITAIGMGLVFAAILLLWGLMALLVRLVKDPVEKDEEEAGASKTETQSNENRRRAAAVAVAIALAQQADVTELREYPLPPTPLVSAWQAVMRTRMLNKRGTKR